MKYEQHPLSAAFPAMSPLDIKALADDIKENGLHSAITIYKGQVLDGWHRYMACEIAKVPPRTVEYRGSKPAEYVRSHNWHRRHMTESQKAMAQVRISEWRESGVTSRSAPGADLPPTTAKMAEDAGVSERTIASAKVVEANGSDELKTAVVQGEVSVKKAAEVAKKPKREQAKALREAKEKKPRAPKAEKSDEWKAKHDALMEEYNELKENRDDLADELKTYAALSGTHPALEMQKLREQLKQVTRRRDELMAQAVEMRKTIRYWESQAKKLGYKAK